MASNRLVFDIAKFNVNQTALNQSVATAMLRAGAAHPLRITPTVLPPHHVPGAPRSRATEAAVTGAVAGGASRVRGMPSLLGPAIAVGLGGYGLSNLNERNQEVVSAQLQTSAVVQQAMGDEYTPQAGRGSFEWLRQQANTTGFNYLEAVPSYNKLISGMTGAGMTVQQGQGVFKGFSEIARVMKLNRVQQGRLFKGLSDVAGKDQLMSEELTGQLAEVLPGAVSLFAEAYQRQIGGKLTGSDATKALRKAMKDKKVTGSILTVAGDIAAERAAPGLEAAKTASQAEQARYQNTISDLAVVASNAGVEEGFARIFRTLNAGLSESNGLVTTLADGFNEATKWADDLLLWPQSFIRALEGKDSLVADWLGKDNIEQLKQDWKDIKKIFDDISSIKFDFLPDLKSTSEEVAKILNAIGEFQRFREGNTGKSTDTQTINLEDIPKIKPFDSLPAYTSPVGIIGAAISNTGVNLNKARDRNEAVYGDPSSVYYHNPEDYDDNQKNMAMDMAKEQATATVSSNQFDININIDPVTLSNMDVKAQAEDLGNWFRGELEKASVNFPIKE